MPEQDRNPENPDLRLFRKCEQYAAGTLSIMIAQNNQGNNDIEAWGTPSFCNRLETTLHTPELGLTEWKIEKESSGRHSRLTIKSPKGTADTGDLIKDDRFNLVCEQADTLLQKMATETQEQPVQGPNTLRILGQNGASKEEKNFARQWFKDQFPEIDVNRVDESAFDVLVTGLRNAKQHNSGLLTS